MSLLRLSRRLLSVPAVLLRRDTSNDAELLVLRHENAVLRRHIRGRVRYEPADRLWFAALSSLLPRRRWQHSAPFCGTCTRARLSADGKLYTCLFATSGQDLRGPLRLGATDADLAELIAGRWASRNDRYSELRGTQRHTAPRIEMSYIGG